MAVAKVTYNGSTLIDLTSDTVVANKLVTGYTAHNSAGELITGTMADGGGAQTNGSLIVSNLSSNITSVNAVYGANTQGAYISNNVAYTTIPYTYTGTVTLNGYVGSELETSGTVNISAIDKYLCPLSTSSRVYSTAGWEGYSPESWNIEDSSHEVQYVSNGIQITHRGTAHWWAAPIPSIHNRNYSKIKFVVSTTFGSYTSPVYIGTCRNAGSYSGGLYEALSDGESVVTHTLDLVNSTNGYVYMFVEFTNNATNTDDPVVIIHSIDFV